ncbi:MAG: dTDP-4-dehydrorhamnose 3,5-epimerase, partial [Pseudomonadota bacterium]
MNVIASPIADVLIIEPKVFGDERGFFFESYNHAQFEAAVGRSVSFVQDNH